MEAKIVSGNISDVGSYNVEFKGGKLVAVVSVAKSPVEANVNVALDSGEVIDAIKRAIPGQVDDALLDVLKAALKA